MSEQPDIEEILARIRERVQARATRPVLRRFGVVGPDRTARGGDRIPSGTTSPSDLTALRQSILEAHAQQAEVGKLNPRNPGLLNSAIQLFKKLMQRSLGWYTRPLHKYQDAVVRSLDAAAKALQSEQNRVSELESGIQSQLAGLQSQLADLEARLADIQIRLRRAEELAVETRKLHLETEKRMRAHVEGTLAEFEARLSAAEQRSLKELDPRP